MTIFITILIFLAIYIYYTREKLYEYMNIQEKIILFFIGPILLIGDMIMYLSDKLQELNSKKSIQTQIKEIVLPPASPERPLDWHEEYKKIQDENWK